MMYIFLTLAFFATIYHFQFWLEPFMDYPHTDEYQSILRALGYPTYTNILYVRMLTFFSQFAPDFFSLNFFNVIAGHMVLAISFFWYHARRGISFSTNLFFTAALTLSSINIALTRKMHFWGAAFFLLIMIAASYLKGNKRTFFLLCTLIGLAFFRVEFAFGAAMALGILVADNIKIKKNFFWITTSLIAFVIATLTIILYGYGMKDLLIESLKIKGGESFFSVAWTWIKLFSYNLVLYSYYSVLSFATTVRVYFPTFALAFIALFFVRDSWKKNLAHFKTVYHEDFLYFYFPALFALLAVRFMDFYVIMTYILLLSGLSFLLNSKRNPLYGMILFLLVWPAYFVSRPDFTSDAYINFPTFKRNAQVHRRMVELIRNLPRPASDVPYKILYNQEVKGFLPEEYREYHLNRELAELCQQGNATFDIVLLPGKWFADPHGEIIESCVLPTLTHHRQIPVAPGYTLYVGPRVAFP